VKFGPFKDKVERKEEWTESFNYQSNKFVFEIHLAPFYSPNGAYGRWYNTRMMYVGTNFLPAIHRPITMKFAMNVRMLIINLLTTIILVIFIELLLGYGMRNPNQIPSMALKPFQKFYLDKDRSILQVTGCAEYDPHFFYRMKPGTCVFSNREFTVINQFNSKGLRDDEESLQSPAIVVLGDSFTMGWGVDQDKTFPALMERALDTKVLNAGVSSFGTARELALLKTLDLPNNPTIIIQYHSNDHAENLSAKQNNFNLQIRSEYQYDSVRSKLHDRISYFPFKYTAGISASFAKLMLASAREKNTTSDTDQAKLFLDVILESSIPNKIVVFKIDRPKLLNNDFVDAVDLLLTQPEFEALSNVSTVRIDKLLDSNDYFILDDHINANGHKKLAAGLNEFFSNHTETILVNAE
jgi:hypothetical protein